jgi:PAS domain S-box-containing protein
MNVITKLSSSNRFKPHLSSTVRKAQAGFAFALICVGVIGLICYQGVNRVREAGELTRHTEEVISSLRLLLSHVTDAETSQRGYTITGEQSYLEQFHEGRRKVEIDLNVLRELTADNAAQQGRLEAMRPFIADRLTRLEAMIELRQSRGFTAVQEVVAQGKGRRLQNEIRGLIGTMETVEKGLLQQRQVYAQRSSAMAKAIILGGSLLALGLLAAALFAVRRDFARRRAQAALAGRLCRMGAWSVDLPVVKVRWSDEVCDIHEEPRGFAPPIDSALDYYAPEFRETIREAFEACVRDGTPFDLELQLVTTKGDRIWVRSIGEAQRDAAGVVLRVQGAFQDITERHQLERELKEAKVAAALREGAERYNFLAEAVPQIIFTTLPDGRLDYANKAWFDFSGMTFDQTKSWGWSTLLHPDDFQECVARWTHAFAMGENFEFEYRLKRASDGAYRWHHGRALPMRDERGQILQWVGTCTDIDDAKRNKETLQTANDELGLRVTERTVELHAAKETAEAANRAKSEFLANMSHEIRTPMNGIIGMTGLLLDTALTASQHEFAETIQFSGEALLTIVNNILDFSKIEAGKLELEIVNVDLAHLVRGTLELLRGTAKSKSLELHASIEPDVPTALRGDGGRLRQVLINLVGNAIKFTSRGEVELHISADRQTNEKAFLRFRITDTGIGITPQTQARLFQAFTQADGSTTRRYGGTGLGLAICKQLVERMEGAIGVESVAGAGSTFWFTVELPKQSESVARIALPEIEETSLHESRANPVTDDGCVRSERVLIAEDNAVNQRVATIQLQKLGYASDRVANGLEVLEALSRVPYDIILMDCQMPELDGYETTRAIRSRGGHRPYIIAMTANAMEGDRELCLVTGMDHYLSKPVRAAALKAALELYRGIGPTGAAGSSADTEPVSAPRGASLSEEILVDIDRLRDVVDDEPGRMQALIDLYLTQACVMLHSLDEAIQANSGHDIARIAHRLVGSSVSCGVEAFTQSLHELERLGLAGDLSEAHALFDDVRHKFPRVQRILTQLATNPSKLEVMAS